MTRASSVARSAATLLSSRLAVAGIALAFLGVSTRLLTLEEMAVFAVYNTVCGMLTVICSLGLFATCIKALPGMLAPSATTGDRAEAAGLLRLSILVQVAGGAVVTLALWLAAGPISRLLLKTADRSSDVRAAVLAALCFALYEASQLLLSALQRFDRLGGYNVGTALAQRASSLALFFPFGLKGYIAGFAVGSLAGALLGFAAILPFLRAPEAAAPTAAGSRGAARWLAWSTPFYLDGYLRYLYMHADQVLVGVLLAPSDLSVYFVAKRFLHYCQVLVSSLVDPLGAKVAELRGSDSPAVARAYEASMRYFVLLFVPLATLLACLSPFLLLVIGGGAYAAGALPLSLLFLSLPFFALFSHLSAFAYALGRPRERVITDLASMSAQAAAIGALIPWMSLAGLALARAIGFGLGALAARWRVGRLLPKATVATRAGGARRAAALCLAPAACMALMILGPHLIIGRPILLPLYALPASAACLAGYFLLVLTHEDRFALAGLVPGRSRAARSVRMALAGGSATDAGTPWI